MTIFEAGTSVGILVGATVGGMAQASKGLAGISVGCVVGALAGSVLGLSYGLLVLSLVHHANVLWCVGQRISPISVTSPTYKTMRGIGKLGTALGVYMSAIVWLTFGWMSAAMVSLGIALITAGIAGFRSEAA